MSKVICLLAIFSIGPVFGQTFDAGIKAGVPATGFFDTGTIGSAHSSAMYSSAARRYSLGLAGEWHITNSWGLELDVMYHRFGYSGTVTSMGVDTFSTAIFGVTGNAWDFPLLAKFRFGNKTFHPFVAAGGTIRYIATAHEQGQQSFFSIGPLTNNSAISTDSPADLNKRVYPGVTAATGIEFGARRLKIIPEVRYTRWTANISSAGGLLRFTPNQVEILVGAEF